MTAPVVCRDCGAPGFEDTNIDLMPNTCAPCFDARIRPIFVGATMATSLDELVERLVAVGCHPERIRRYLAHCATLYHTRN